MQALPRRVEIVEMGTRDGFQMEQRWIPTEVKAEVVDAIARAGVKIIQVTSFVHPRAVPQLRQWRRFPFLALHQAQDLGLEAAEAEVVGAAQLGPGERMR